MMCDNLIRLNPFSFNSVFCSFRIYQFLIQFHVFVFIATNCILFMKIYNIFKVIETNSLGRVVHLDPVTGKVRTLMDGLYLANGIALSEDESFLVVSEMSICRIQKCVLIAIVR